MYGVFDETTGMWLEKDACKYGDTFTVCRPEQVSKTCMRKDRDDAASLCEAWKAELGEIHSLCVKEIRIPDGLHEEQGLQYPVRLNEHVEFPDNLTYEMLSSFLPTKLGSTRPCVGKIGDWKFVAKFGSHTSDAHVLNEAFADQFIRAAGFRAPLSRTYFVSDGVRKEWVRLSQYIEDAVALKDTHRYLAHWNPEVKEQVRQAYPIQALIANVGAFEHDNVLVDRKGRVWFVDNGATFEWRARGGLKEKASGFSYNWCDRRVSYVSGTEGGVMGLYESSDQLQKLLGVFTDEDVARIVFGMNLRALVAGMPEEYRTPAFVAYADSMAEDAEETYEDGEPFRAWKYAYKFYDGRGENPYDGEKDATAAFFWNAERDVECREGCEHIVNWLFETSRPNDWPKFLQEVRATRDELALVLYFYETRRRTEYGSVASMQMHQCFGVSEPSIDWKRYFAM